MEALEFAGLAQEEQIRRIEILGRRALEEFGIEPVSVQSLVHAENTTFRVAANEGEFCLRVCRPGYQSDANVESEIAFVGALGRAGFDVPKPYENRVVKVSVADVPEPRNCVLLGWQMGEFARPGLSISQANQLGRAMARLHSFSMDWTAPEGFDRQELHAWRSKRLALESPTDMLDEPDRLLLLEVLEESRALLETLPRKPDKYGLIHGDLHRGNVLFDEDQIRIIDFDDTGWGFWVADMAAALAYELQSDSFPQLLQSMLAGYAEERAVPVGFQEALPAFIRMRFMTITEWVLNRKDNPHLRETGPAWLKGLCDDVRRSRSGSLF